MGARALRRRCAAVLRGFDVPRPFDLNTFVRGIEQVRGRRLVLMAVTTEASSPCGLWMADPATGTDYVMYEAVTTPLRQVHIVLHEIGHLLFRHRGMSPFATQFLATALPDLDAQAVVRALGRTTFTSIEEAEAEM